MSDSWGSEIFGLDTEEDGKYRPWRTCQQGSTMYFKIAPAKGSDAQIHYIPYLQAISMALTPDGTQLWLQCHSTDQRITIEGRALQELAEQISAKRVKSIHEFSPDDYGAASNDAEVVSKISVENAR